MTRQDIIDASNPSQPGAGVRANYIRQGVDLEQERIIKVLEREREWLVSTGDEDNIRDADGFVSAIALIKGEAQ